FLPNSPNQSSRAHIGSDHCSPSPSAAKSASIARPSPLPDTHPVRRFVASTPDNTGSCLSNRDGIQQPLTRTGSARPADKVELLIQVLRPSATLRRTRRPSGRAFVPLSNSTRTMPHLPPRLRPKESR